MSVSAVTAVLRERLGIDPDSLGTGAIESAIAVRMRALGSDDLAAYASRIAVDAEEFQALAEDISVPETWFFRGGIDLFTHLAAGIRQRVLNPVSALETGFLEVHKNPVSKAETGLERRAPFRVLSAPCSSGEEAYSLAIALAECGVPPTACTIEGIDISRPALEKARAGRYRNFSFRQTDAALRERYFRPLTLPSPPAAGGEGRVRGTAGGGWEIAATLRDSVRFRQSNLLEPGSLASDRPYDLIFCRNLLIYLHTAARVRVIDNLTRFLAPGGLLCTGHAEPIQLQDTRFEIVQPERFMLYRWVPQAKQTRRPEQPARPRAKPPVRRATPAAVATPTPSLVSATARVVDQDGFARARQLADAGQIDAALEACTAHLDRAGPSASTYALLGILRQARHEKDEATRCFEKALYLEPDHDEALTHLMVLCQQLGENDRAANLRRRLERTRSGEKT